MADFFTTKSLNLVGFDLVEVAPDYDHSGTTAFLAARVILDFLGYIFEARTQRRDQPLRQDTPNNAETDGERR